MQKLFRLIREQSYFEKLITNTTHVLISSYAIIQILNCLNLQHSANKEISGKINVLCKNIYIHTCYILIIIFFFIYLQARQKSN